MREQCLIDCKWKRLKLKKHTVGKTIERRVSDWLGKWEVKAEERLIETTKRRLSDQMHRRYKRSIRMERAQIVEGMEKMYVCMYVCMYIYIYTYIHIYIYICHGISR